ncbi:hypothetical protein B0T14DRAFT_504580 [Immersiella caudata]|uniref:Uncharacterized protein n=1 Tax=Immersiella caudata TaxID=314043 RepID=A0AA39XEN5_9PEZI|nr:hypothetical protein B0T14DRAFT_504580 [Immersiella caudata]
MSDLPPEASASALATANLPGGAPPELHEQVPANLVPVEPQQNIPLAQATQGQTDTKDVDMVDLPQPTTATPPTVTQPSIPPAPSLVAPSPLPPRVSTPMRNSTTNGETERTGSRAASAHPDTGFTMPSEAPPHGAPVRQYLNTKVTGVLLDGMKLIAYEQPKDPLRVLGEYLLTRSKELEGTAS